MSTEGEYDALQEEHDEMEERLCAKYDRRCADVMWSIVCTIGNKFPNKLDYFFDNSVDPKDGKTCIGDLRFPSEPVNIIWDKIPLESQAGVVSTFKLNMPVDTPEFFEHVFRSLRMKDFVMDRVFAPFPVREKENEHLNDKNQTFQSDIRNRLPSEWSDFTKILIYSRLTSVVPGFSLVFFPGSAVSVLQNTTFSGDLQNRFWDELIDHVEKSNERECLKHTGDPEEDPEPVRLPDSNIKRSTYSPDTCFVLMLIIYESLGIDSGRYKKFARGDEGGLLPNWSFFLERAGIRMDADLIQINAQILERCIMRAMIAAFGGYKRSMTMTFGNEKPDFVTIHFQLRYCYCRPEEVYGQGFGVFTGGEKKPFTFGDFPVMSRREVEQSIEQEREEIGEYFEFLERFNPMKREHDQKEREERCKIYQPTIEFNILRRSHEDFYNEELRFSRAGHGYLSKMQDEPVYHYKIDVQWPIPFQKGMLRKNSIPGMASFHLFEFISFLKDDRRNRFSAGRSRDNSFVQMVNSLADECSIERFQSFLYSNLCSWAVASLYMRHKIEHLTDYRQFGASIFEIANPAYAFVPFFLEGSVCRGLELFDMTTLRNGIDFRDWIGKFKNHDLALPMSPWEYDRAAGLLENAKDYHDTIIHYFGETDEHNSIPFEEFEQVRRVREEARESDETVIKASLKSIIDEEKLKDLIPVLQCLMESFKDFLIYVPVRIDGKPPGYFAILAKFGGGTGYYIFDETTGYQESIRALEEDAKMSIGGFKKMLDLKKQALSNEFPYPLSNVEKLSEFPMYTSRLFSTGDPSPLFNNFLDEHLSKMYEEYRPGLICLDKEYDAGNCWGPHEWITLLGKVLDDLQDSLWRSYLVMFECYIRYAEPAVILRRFNVFLAMNMSFRVDRGDRRLKVRVKAINFSASTCSTVFSRDDCEVYCFTTDLQREYEKKERIMQYINGLIYSSPLFAKDNPKTILYDRLVDTPIYKAIEEDPSSLRNPETFGKMPSSFCLYLLAGPEHDFGINHAIMVDIKRQWYSGSVTFNGFHRGPRDDGDILADQFRMDEFEGEDYEDGEDDFLLPRHKGSIQKLLSQVDIDEASSVEEKEVEEEEAADYPVQDEASGETESVENEYDANEYVQDEKEDIEEEDNEDIGNEDEVTQDAQNEEDEEIIIDQQPSPDTQPDNTIIQCNDSERRTLDFSPGLSFSFLNEPPRAPKLLPSLRIHECASFDIDLGQRTQVAKPAVTSSREAYTVLSKNTPKNTKVERDEKPAVIREHPPTPPTKVAPHIDNNSPNIPIFTAKDVVTKKKKKMSSNESPIKLILTDKKEKVEEKATTKQNTNNTPSGWGNKQASSTQNPSYQNDKTSRWNKKSNAVNPWQKKCMDSKK